ncbi:LysE/ArgO family amino acid transporter [Legionella jordanis]|uniref:LysE family transporter n=1 Tax=Legionella jordanis TaxID=456 RepID=A0A0W0VCI7_9GAMM|nr:LysE family transporter [Legionella jordanis]KTD17827.1 LysE family transporter [Legionella jordanis]RMX02472.1 amino acid transporter [Legionella jordanis]RMX21685.1 amino acid transporter [Legionella jordanis]VEH11236.1 LysE family transporter [Legionella jordanis]HAT8713796.1 amino acid transporter [Legionella jordanis]
MLVYFNGLFLGLSLITALGPQNVFLIRQGALGKYAMLSAVVCFFCDVILVSGSVAGLHKILELHPVFQVWITWFGVAFLSFYGTKALQQAFARNPVKNKAAKEATSRWQIIALALGFSLLNPHAIIDSLVIIGGGSSQFPEHKQAFLFGVITSSLFWFSALTLTTRYFAKALSRPTIWRNIELASGMLMFFLSFKLACTQF